MGLGFGLRSIAQAFDISVKRVSDENNNQLNQNWQYACTFVVLGRHTRTIHSMIGFKNLPLGIYRFKFEPIASLEGKRVDKDGNDVIYKSTREGNTFRIQPEWYDRNPSFRVAEYGTNAQFSGVVMKIEGQISTIDSSRFDDWDNNNLREVLDKWEDIEFSFEESLPFVSTSVNEIVVSDETITYPDVSVLEVEMQASERLSSPPKMSVELEEGKVVDSYFGWGIVDQKKDDKTFTVKDSYLEVSIPEVSNPDFRIAVLDPKRNRRSWVNFNNGEYITENSSFSQLKEGDEVVFYVQDSTCFLPDIFVDLLLEDKYGLGATVKPRMIDWLSIIESKKFCYENNYFWDGVISTKQNFSDWVIEQATTCLLLPVRKEGKYGLIPESPNLPIKQVFNESNILKGSFTRSTIPTNQRKVNKVILVYTNGNDERKQKISVEVLTKEAFEGRTRIKEVQKSFPSITRTEQAIDVAISTLNSARYQTEQVSFKTDTLGISLEPGDIIVCQQRVDQFDYTSSGLITNAQSDSNGLSVEIDNPLKKDYKQYSCYIKFWQQGGQTLQIGIIGRTEDNQKLKLEETYTDSSGNTQNTPVPSPGDPIILVNKKIENLRYRVQSVDFSEDGIDIKGLEWTPKILAGTSLDQDRTTQNVESGYQVINNEIYVFRE